MNIKEKNEERNENKFKGTKFNTAGFIWFDRFWLISAQAH